LCLPLRHRSIASIAVRHGRKAAARLGRKVTPACGPQLSPCAVRYGCKVVARSRVQIDRAIQLLLGYGLRCRVVGGEEVRREMETNVRAMANLHKLPVWTGS